MSATQPQEQRLGTLPPATRGGTPPGLYIMQLVDVLAAGKSQFADRNGNFQEQARWVCKIVKVIDSEARDPQALINTEWWKWTTLGMGPRGNMRKFTEAFADRQLDDDEALDVDEIIGKYAKVHLAEKQGDKGAMEIHVTMTPYKAERKASKPKPTVVEAPADDDWDDESTDAPF